MLLESYAQEVGSTLGALEAIARSTEREVCLPAGPLLDLSSSLSAGDRVLDRVYREVRLFPARLGTQPTSQGARSSRGLAEV